MLIIKNKIKLVSWKEGSNHSRMAGEGDIPTQMPYESVRALYSYTYEDEGETFSMNEGEVYHLLNHNSSDWWQVCRTDSSDPFYVPSSYVEIIEQSKTLDDDSLPQHINSNDNASGNHGNAVVVSKENNVQFVTFSKNDDQEKKLFKSNIYVGSFKPQMEESNEDNSESLNGENSGSTFYANLENEYTESKLTDGAIPGQYMNTQTSVSSDFGGEYVNLEDLRAASGMPQCISASESDNTASDPSNIQPLDSAGVIYANLEDIQGADIPPPFPENSKFEKTLLGTTWDMYLDPLSNRVFYVHKETKERNWKPPRGTFHTELAKQRSSGSATSSKSQSPTSETPDPLQTEIQEDKLGPSYKGSTSTSSLERGIRSFDDSVKPFRSYGSLERPQVPSSSSPNRARFQKTRSVMIESLQFNIPPVNTGPAPPKSATLPPNFNAPIPEVPSVTVRLDGFGTRKASTPDIPQATRHFAQSVYLNDPIEGMLIKTKIVNGKKERGGKKNTYVKLAGSNLVFYKDQRSSQPTKASPNGKYEEMVPLVTCRVEKDPKEYKSKKYSILLTTPDCQFLLQHDDDVKIKEWFLKLHMKIQQVGGHPDTPKQEQVPIVQPEPDLKRKPSFKVKDGRPSDTREKGRIRDILQKFIINRTPQTVIVAKGIYKDAVFGAELKQLCDREKQRVPTFVTRCIAAIEARGLHHEGLYRLSGNLSVVQKLRCTVDQTSDYNLDDPKWDISVLTGALKMFFRELKEPVFTYALFDKFLKSYLKQSKSERLKAIRNTMQEVPRHNQETIKVLFTHLTNVMEHSTENKMGAQQLAIVIGPNLIYPEQQTQNLATSMVYQGRIVEFIMCEYKNIFR